MIESRQELRKHCHLLERAASQLRSLETHATRHSDIKAAALAKDGMKLVNY
jgi:hypothetical protein